jgi:hypothetical protein
MITVTTFFFLEQLVDLYKPYLRSDDHISTISVPEDPSDNVNYLKLLPGTRGVYIILLSKYEIMLNH